jgi:carotenoid cleavage dioxygenase-like enzyme
MVNHQSLDFLGFATDPCRSIFKRFFAAFFTTPSLKLHNANINVAKFCADYVALTEIPLPVRFDPTTLETLGAFEYADTLPIDNIWTSAHPHYDEKKGEWISYIVEFSLHSHYVIYTMSDRSSARVEIARIPVSKPSYMHSFALTENYIVLVEYPIVVNPLNIALTNKFIDNYHWQPELGTTFLVVNRVNGDVVGRFKGASFYSFHHVNAFEQGQSIVLDIITYPDAEIVMALADYGTGVSEPGSQLVRYTLDLGTGKVAHHVISSLPFELPRINSSYDGKPYCYAYAADLREILPEGELRKIVKIDVEKGSILSWGELGCYPGEPVFVPHPEAQHEDHGVVLTVVISEPLGHAFLLILDAATFQEMGRAEVPHQIPMGLHGAFY